MKYAPLLLTLAVVLMLPADNGHAGERQRFKRDMYGAEYSILSSLLVHLNLKSKYLCVQNPYACVGPDRAELGLAMLASSNQPEAPRKLVELIRFKFDAGLSTDYKCYLSARRPEVSPYLRDVDAGQLSHQCITEVTQFISKSKRGLYEIPVDSICRSSSEIEAELKLMSKAVRSSRCDGF